MIKDLVVYLDGSERDEPCLGFGEHIASAHDAVMTGLSVNRLADVSVAAGIYMVDPQVIRDIQAESLAKGARLKDRIIKRFTSVGARNAVRHIDVLPGEARGRVATEARTADLFVAMRPYGSGMPEETQDVVETVLFSSGRASLLVPPSAKVPQAYDTIVLAWRNQREAARAMSEAMPFLTKAKSVIVVMVDENGAPEEVRAEPGADVARHLGRHNINIELRHVSGWDRVSAALLNEVEKSGAQMLVMGAFGHSRFREWVLGGATREVLETAGVPVLVAH